MMQNGVGIIDGSPVHSEHMDETLTIVFSNCNTGLGIKIVGGKSDEDIHKDYGIFIRRVIPGGLASKEGRLREGDQILSVNGESLLRVSNERAVQLLRNASATNHVTLVVTRNPSAMRRFSELLDSQLAGLDSSRASSSGSTSPTGSQSSIASSQHGQYLPGNREWSTSPMFAPRAASPAFSDTSSTSSHHSQQSLLRLPNMHEISVSKVSGLGISIQGGRNNLNGPAVSISHIVPGGDCHKDGRIKTGDQLVAIDGISLIGLTHEAAKAVLTRTRLRTDKDTVDIAYIPSQQLHSPNTRPVESSPNQYQPVQTSHIQSGHRSPVLTSPQLHGGRAGSPITHTSNAQQQNKYNQPQLLRTSPSPHQQNSSPSPYNQQPLRTSPSPLQHNSSPLPQPVARVSSPTYAQQQSVPGSYQMPGGIGLPGMDAGFQGLPYEKLLLQAPTMSSTPQDGHAITNPVTDDLRRLVLNPGLNFGISPVLANNSNGVMAGNFQNTLQSSRQSPSPVSRSVSPGRRLSLDPHVRLKIDKLEVALRYLGISPNEEQKQAIRNRLRVDHSGTVPYGEFVSVTKELFKMQLDESHLSASEAKSFDVTDFADPPPFQPHIYDQVPNNLGISEVDVLRQERDDALRQVDKLKIMLQEKERACNDKEQELRTIRKEAQGFIQDSRALKSRVHLAEAAQKEARNMEVDYEEAMRLLEDEIAELSQKLKVAQQTKSPEVSRSATPTDIHKRLAVLGCELRKVEVSKRTYEVATLRLLQFAELVHEVVTDGPGLANGRGRGESSRRYPDGSGHRPPGYLAKHSKAGPINLADESRDTVRAVKALIEVEPLPYGWEEAYTKDGMRYYINHVTQCTSWIHPVSNINHSPDGMPQRPPTAESRT